MLEHERAYSHYRGSVTWSNFVAAPIYRQLHADLSGVGVDVVYLLRHGQARFQTDAHRGFWAQWFAHAGAASVTFTGVSAPRTLLSSGDRNEARKR